MSISRQARALEALLSSSTVKQAAQAAGVSERQVYRWLLEPEFSAKLKQGESERITSALRGLSGLAGEAVQALASVMRAPAQDGANVKRLASANVLELLLKAREQIEIIERIEALEEGVRRGK